MDKSTKHKRKKSSYDKRYDSSDSEEAKHKANGSSGKHKHSNESDDYEKSKYYLKHKNDSETSSSKHKTKKTHHYNLYDEDNDDKYKERDGNKRGRIDGTSSSYSDHSERKSHYEDKSYDRNYKDTKKRYIDDADDRNEKRKHCSSFDDNDSVRKKHQDHSKGNERNKSQVITPDYEFNWEEHCYHLDKIFFHRDGIIRKNSEEYTDFWNFLKKYIAFQKKKGEGGVNKSDTLSNVDGESDVPVNKFGIPLQYNKKYKLSFGLQIDCNVTAIADLHGRRVEKELNEERREQFKQILLHYFDFIQKQKLTKLKKIKTDKENLPIYKYKEKIIDTVKENQVVVVAGDTGCGKSTQVPQYLIAAGYENIACTQPRRIACISLSKRVSHETLNEYGSEVAFQVRFEKSRTQSTKILFLTEGLLLRQIGSDALLSQYNVIVIDEVHERHIHTDFLLGVVKCILKQRKDLKLILMSATINIDMFSSYFDNAPVVSVPGRLYPIQLQYIPVSVEEQGSKTEKLDPSPYLRVLQSIDKKYQLNERGDVLMFLSGLTEIMTVVDAARQYSSKTNKWIILPLHSALSIEEQDKVFDFPPEGVRKCIVSTNIAETSVTIDGVRFVVDSGKVKEMNFDTKYKMQKLQECWISRASSEQRKGRAGRTGPGVCFRLYAESDYDALQAYSTPEIQRVPLDSILLQMADLGLPNARLFPFIERPDDIKVENSILYLKEQGAFDEKEELTAVGKMLAQLPVDMVIGKMLIMGSLFDMIEPVLCISSALSVQSPYTVRGQRDSDAIAAREKLQSDHGDPFTLLNAFDEWLQMKAEGRDSRKWCKRRGLEEQRFYEMSKLKKNFRDLLQDHGLIERQGNVEEKSREERKQMNLDRKRLKELRHEQKSQSKKRKVLKLDDDNWEIERGLASDTETMDENVAVDFSVKDLEFRLTHDLSKVQNQSNTTHSFTLKEINILKVILCSGLYPQFAIADEHNGFKSSSEQIFHTKNKGFVVLHPTSVFCANPDALQPSVVKDEHGNKATKDGPSSSHREVISNQHQLLTFVSLVETNKPYMTGVMRVPALQVLLFASEVDTNSDCTRIVCDTWLEISLDSTPEEAESLISNMYKLRNAWAKLINLKLKNVHHNYRNKKDNKQGIEVHFEKDKTDVAVRRLQRYVSQKLAEFLLYDINYTLRRVMSAEAAHMYVGAVGEGDLPAEVNQAAAVEIRSDLLNKTEKKNTDDDVDDDEIIGGFKLGSSHKTSHPVKGGQVVAPYLVLSCLVDSKLGAWGEYATYMQKHWTCPKCDTALVVTFAEQLQHEAECGAKDNAGGNENKEDLIADELETEEERIAKNKNLKEYHCANCDKTYHFTTVEILKHRKSCKS